MKKFILAALILFLPFQLKIPQIPVMNTINLFLVILTLIYIFGKNPNAPKSKIDTPLLIFLILWIASLIHALFYSGGIYASGFYIWDYALFVEFKRLFTLVLAYFVFARCLKTEKEMHFLFYVFLFGLVLVGLYTWRNGMLAGPNFANFKRSSGPFGFGFIGSDIAGGFIAIFTPFILSYSLLAKRKILKIAGFVGVSICFMGIFATYSRGSILAIGIASFITISAVAKSLLKTSKISVVIILMVFIGLGFAWKHWVPESIINRAEATVQQQDFTDETNLDESAQGRLITWKKGLEIFNTNPIFGVGFKIPQYEIGIDTHNAFLQILTEMGIIGILAFLWFLFNVLREARPLLNTKFAFLGAGFIGCLSAFVVVNMFYSNFFRDTVVGSFWIILGMLTASKNYVIKNR